MSPKLKGLKAGDRIRVTSEAEVFSVEGGKLCAVIDGTGHKTTFSSAYVDAPTFGIEKLPNYPAPGKLITWGEKFYPWEVLTIRDEQIVLYREGTVLTRRLEQIANWEEVPA